MGLMARQGLLLLLFYTLAIQKRADLQAHSTSIRAALRAHRSAIFEEL